MSKPTFRAMGETTDARTNKGDNLLTTNPDADGMPLSEPIAETTNETEPIAPTEPSVASIAAILSPDNVAALTSNPLFSALLSAALSQSQSPVSGATIARTTRIQPNFDPTVSATTATQENAQWIAVIMGCDDMNNGAFPAADKMAAYKRALSVVQGYRGLGAKFDGNGKSYVWRGIALPGDVGAAGRFIAYMDVAQFEKWRNGKYPSGPLAGITFGDICITHAAKRRSANTLEPEVFVMPGTIVPRVAENVPA
jgi:hypothetical protein